MTTKQRFFFWFATQKTFASKRSDVDRLTIMLTNPEQTFTSLDKFERITRREVAESLSDRVGYIISSDDDRLDDQLCYDYVNALSFCGDDVESWDIVEDEEPGVLDRFKKPSR